MEQMQREEISEKDITIYVDMLLQKHRFLYDKRVAPLLYEFFLRSHKTFNWSKDEFLDKYINFDTNVKKIRFKKLEKNTAEMNFIDNAIYINQEILSELKNANEETYNNFINAFYHENSHAIDFYNRNGKRIHGLLKIEDNEEKDVDEDILFNEYANIITSALISSNTGLYSESTKALPKLLGYSDLHIPGAIMCTAFGISEKKIAELKDKGREEFDKYFKEKYPYLKTDVIIEAFRDNFNLIDNSVNNEDKENIILGHKNTIEIANEIIRLRLKNAFIQKPDEEFTQRVYLNLEKIYTLKEEIIKTYKIDEVDLAQVREDWIYIAKLFNFYKKFKDNEEIISNDGQVKILEQIKEGKLDIETLKSEIGVEKLNEGIDYDPKEIADKYYSDLTKPLNDNTELIEHLRKAFSRPTIKERLENIKNKFKRIKQLPIPDAPQSRVEFKAERSNLKHSIQAETPIASFDKQKKTEKQQTKDEMSR